MGKHPHRKAKLGNIGLSNFFATGNFGKTNIAQLFFESNFKKFKLDVLLSDYETFACIAWASLMCLVFSFTGSVLDYFGFTIPYHGNLVIMAFGIVLLLELFLPVPISVTSQVINEVRDAEESDGLDITDKWWIYTHYFIFRGHPLLSRFYFLVRLAIITAVVGGLLVLFPYVWVAIVVAWLLTYYGLMKWLMFLCE